MKSYILVTAILVATLSAPGAVVHRYSFTADANDIAGTAHGTLLGAAAVSDGQLVLDGSTDTYVNLPNGLISGLTNATFEAWFTWNGGGPWQRVFDFGSSAEGEDLSGGGVTYAFVTPAALSATGPIRFGFTTNSPPEQVLLDRAGPAPIGEQVYVAVSYDNLRNVSRLFVNGARAAIGPAGARFSDVDDINNWLGRAQFNDPFLNASINEFRIHDGALDAAQVAANAQAGPDTLGGDPGAASALALTVPAQVVVGGTGAATVQATYSGPGAVDITGDSGLTFSSSDTAVATINAGGVITAVQTGTTTITASAGGSADGEVVTVIAVPLPPAELRHRYSFTGTPGSGAAVEDLTGTADAALVNGADYTGAGQVALDNPNSAYVDLPNGIISALTNATFESWVTFAAQDGAWQRIFDFGDNAAGEDAQGAGESYLFLTPRVGTAGVLRFAVRRSNATPRVPILDGPSTLPAEVESHVVVTYNVSGAQTKLYLNGLLVAQGTAEIPLADINDINNWLGRSNWPDAGFGGSYNEFRIYEGVLDPFQIAVHSAAGPDNANPEPGALQSVALTLSTNSIPVAGVSQANVRATFANVSNVEITTLPETTITSSSPTVVEVTAGGELQGKTAGTATITAAYQGQTSTASITVVAPALPLTLLHRYSFDTPTDGITIEDLVGDKNGTLMGDATFTNGQLRLPGGAAASTTAGYVDLPNGMISSLPETVSFESFVTWRGGGVWQRIFDFGSNTAGEDAQGTGETYLFLSPQGGPGFVRVAFTISSGGGENPVLDGTRALPANQASHVILVYDYAQRTARLYTNGAPVRSRTVVNPLSALDDYNNWLGRSNWPDAFFAGSYDEFRIWQGAMTDADAAKRFAAGPDNIGEPAPAAPTLTAALSAGNIRIAWPLSAEGFNLYSTLQLGAGAAWTAVTTAPVTEGDQKVVSLPAGTGNQFFQLQK